MACGKIPFSDNVYPYCQNGPRGRHSRRFGGVAAAVAVSKASIMLSRDPRQNGAVIQAGGLQVEPFKRVRRLVAGSKAQDQKLVEAGPGLDNRRAIRTPAARTCA